MWTSNYRTISSTVRLTRQRSPRFQPNISTLGPGNRVLKDDKEKFHDPKYLDLIDFDYIHKDNYELRKRQAHIRVNVQGRHTMAEYWPEKDGDKWNYLTTPLIPNYIPLPGRDTDNQLRNLSEATDLTLPWFEDLLNEKISDLTSSGEPISSNRINALKRLCSVGFVGEDGKHKIMLLKIMARPLMEHRHDYHNDAVRVCALTIDIREIQDKLIIRQHLASRNLARTVVILQRQRDTVLSRLRGQNFELYCKTMDLLNLEHHMQPVLKTVARKPFTERIIDMKLRTMNQIEKNIKADQEMKRRLDTICDRGEKIFQTEKDYIHTTKNIRELFLSNIAEITALMKKIEAKCLGLSLNAAMWTHFDSIQAETKEFAVFFQNVNGLQSKFDLKIEEIQSFKRKIKYYQSQERKSLSLLETVRNLDKHISKWEEIISTVESISRIAARLDELEQTLISKFNAIESKQNQDEFVPWLEKYANFHDEYESIKTKIDIDLDEINLDGDHYESIYTKSSSLLKMAKKLAEE